MKVLGNINNKGYFSFGVKKSDSIASFINEIKVTNSNLEKYIDSLDIIQKIKNVDTFDNLAKKINDDRSIINNIRKVTLNNYNKFKLFINAIGVKILEELKDKKYKINKFQINTQDIENNIDEKNNIIEIYIQKRKKQIYRNKNKKHIKEYQKKYYQKNKDIISIKRQQYNEKLKEMRIEYYKNIKYVEV